MVRVRTACFAALVAAALPVSAPARPHGSPPAAAAMRLCEEGDEAGEDERRAVWARGLAVAEEAVSRHPDDPVAHFAVFCNLGKRVAVAGLGFEALRALPRLRDHIDRALRLCPDYDEALAAKGALLLRLPGFLGGDLVEAERLLRAALALSPDNAEARDALAEALRRQGRDPRAEATCPPTMAATPSGDDAPPADATPR